MRLGKLVAHRAGMSRKQAGRLIKRGLVSIDGVVLRSPAAAVPDDATVVVDGVTLGVPPTVAVWHKPVGVQCTVGDDWGRESLEVAAGDLIAMGLHPVGRLDAETSGLLIFAASGRLTQHMLHPKRALERVYVARVDPAPTAALAEVLAGGVETADGTFAAEVKSIDSDVVTLSVREGRNRMVRRILANSGHPVVELIRIRFGPFELADLPEGEWRQPTDVESRWLAEVP